MGERQPAGEPATRTAPLAECTTLERLHGLARQDLPIAHDPTFARETFLRVGGYRHALTRYEDLDLQLRLADAVPDWRHSGMEGTAYGIGGGLSRADKFRQFQSDLAVLLANPAMLECRLGADAFEAAVRHRFAARMDEHWKRLLDR